MIVLSAGHLIVMRRIPTTLDKRALDILQQLQTKGMEWLDISHLSSFPAEDVYAAAEAVGVTLTLTRLLKDAVTLSPTFEG